MRRAVLFPTASRRIPLALIAALLVGASALLGLAIKPGNAQTSPTTPTYIVKDLGTLGGSSSASTHAFGINSGGQVVGRTSSPSGYPAFLYDESATPKMKDLGTLTGGHNQSDALDVNSLGEVVGNALDANSKWHAFLYKNNAMQDIGTLGTYYSTASARGINDSGKVVGYSYNDGGNRRAFLYDESATPKMKDLGTLNTWGGSSEAWDINSSSQVVGTAMDTNARDRAFLYENGTMKNLGTLENDAGSYADSHGIAINDSGQVAGYSSATGGYHAFLYDESATPKMKDLGTLPGGHHSQAYGINGSGQVVGIAGGKPFLYSGGQMTDLNTMISTDSGWYLSEANDINDSGQIVGSGYKNGQYRAFLLTSGPDTEAPTTTATPTPEQNSAGWNNANVEVALSATDNGGFGVEEIIYAATGAQQIAEQTVSGRSATLPAITAEGETTITYHATDTAGNAEAEQTFKVKLDKTTPDAVSGLSAAPGNSKADLSWTNPTASDLDKVRVLRSTSGAATSPEPASGQTQVYEGTATSYSDTGLTNGTKYYYTVFATDTAGNWSSAASANATPMAPPPPDTTAPTGSVLINSGKAKTKKLAVTLNLAATDSDSGVKEMCVSNSTTCTSWEPFTSTKSWKLIKGGSKTKTVYVKFRDNAGNESAAFKDTIKYAP